MRFSQFVGHENAKLALILNAIDANCGGAIFIGERGSGKSTLCRLFKEILPPEIPFIEVPLNVTEDSLLGMIDLERTMKTGKRTFNNGLLSKANGGFLYIENINLFPKEIIALILNAKESQCCFVEREGFSLVLPTKFIPIATMTTSEGMFPQHFLDRFGFCLIWESLKEKEERIRVIKTACDDIFPNHYDRFDLDLQQRIDTARRRLINTKVPEDMVEIIAELCKENNVISHRCEITLFYASRAYAAYLGDEKVEEKHILTILPIVLPHRITQQPPLETIEKMEPKAERKENHPEKEHTHERGSEQYGRQMFKSEEKGEVDSAFSFQVNPKEEIMEIGKVYKIKRFAFPMDKKERISSGRRSNTYSKGSQGRYIKSSFKGQKNDIAIDATLRAAAPFQQARGKKEILIIREEDLRYKKREKKISHLFLFVVDASGSMGANRRMVETKAAIKSLLLDCYQKRDSVALIAFRKDKAELVLPPTSSPTFAERKLANLPIGGKTPLSAGLLEAYKLIKREKFKDPSKRIILLLITDGKANQSLTGANIKEEIRRISLLLRAIEGVVFLLIDTEDKRGLVKTDLGPWIANILGARYLQMEELKAESIVSSIRFR